MAETDNIYDDADEPKPETSPGGESQDQEFDFSDLNLDDTAAGQTPTGKAEEDFDLSDLGLDGPGPNDTDAEGEAGEFDFSSLEADAEDDASVSLAAAASAAEQAQADTAPEQPRSAPEPPAAEPPAPEPQAPEQVPEEQTFDDMPSTPNFSGMAIDSAKEAFAAANDDDAFSPPTPASEAQDPGEPIAPPPVDLSKWTGSIETSGKASQDDEADEAPQPEEPAEESFEEPIAAPEATEFDESDDEPGTSSGPDIATLHADAAETPPGLYDQISSSKFNEELRSPQLSETIGAATAVAASRRTTSHAELKGKAEELFRGMWASVFYSGRMTGKAVVVCSPSRHEGASTIACGLAVAGSGPAGGARVCLVDFNLRAPAVHEMLGLRQAPGLMDVLSGQAELHAVINGVNDSLDVITVGNMTNRSLDVLRSDAVESLFDILNDAYDYILVDTAAANHYPDAQVLAGVVGDVVLVTHADQTPREAVAQAKKRVEAGGGKVTGLVLNQRSFPIPTFLYRRV